MSERESWFARMVAPPTFFDVHAYPSRSATLVYARRAEFFEVKLL